MGDLGTEGLNHGPAPKCRSARPVTMDKVTSRPVRIAGWTVWGLGAVALLPGSVGWVLMWTALWLVVIGVILLVQRLAKT